MKADSNPSSSPASLPQRKSDPGKLVSLLALASGAIAMPQTGHAGIWSTNLTSPVTVGFSGVDSYELTLSGDVQFGFRRYHYHADTSGTAGNTLYYRKVRAGRIGGSVTAGLQASSRFVVPRAKSDNWDGLSAVTNAPVGIASLARSVGSITFASNHSPDSYPGHKYLAFEFVDTLHSSALRYGWVEILLANGNLDTSSGPNVTIYGYGYDDQGNPIAMGAVPEPTSTMLFVLGALTFGAKGLRAWRRNQAGSAKS